MKRSTYNSVIPLDSGLSLLYNAVSDEFLVFKNGLLDKEWNPESLGTQLYDRLKQGEFIIDEDVDEKQRYIDKSIRKLETDRNFHIIVNPTLQCNFRCWYCYEEHLPSKMDESTVSGVKNLIGTLAKQGKNVTLSFFGGEPLIYYAEIMKPLIEYANTVCNENGVGFETNATSNGFLFTKPVIEELHANNFKYVQITLDGNEEQHNKVRHTADGLGSYKRIVSNICLLAQNGIEIILRFNYTPDNINGIKDVAQEFAHLSGAERGRIHVSLHRVWQEEDVEPVVLEQAISAYTQLGIDAKPTLFGDFCYGDKPNSIVVNFNGDLYKCTAVDFFNTPLDGYISSDGSLHWENGSLEKRLSMIFSNAECQTCRIFPLCHGGCSTWHIKSPDGYCILDYNDEKKDDVILQRFLFNLRSKRHWQSMLLKTEKP